MKGQVTQEAVALLSILTVGRIQGIWVTRVTEQLELSGILHLVLVKAVPAFSKGVERVLRQPGRARRNPHESRQMGRSACHRLFFLPDQHPAKR